MKYFEIILFVFCFTSLRASEKPFSEQCRDKAKQEVKSIQAAIQVVNKNSIPILDKKFWRNNNTKLIREQENIRLNVLDQFNTAENKILEKNRKINEIFSEYDIEKYFKTTLDKDSTLLDIIVVCSYFRDYQIRKLRKYLDPLKDIEDSLVAIILDKNKQVDEEQKNYIQENSAKYKKTVDNRFFLHNGFAVVIQSIYEQIRIAYIQHPDNDFDFFKDEMVRAIENINADILLININYKQDPGIIAISEQFNGLLQGIQDFSYKNIPKPKTQDLLNEQLEGLISKTRQGEIFLKIGELSVGNNEKDHELTKNKLYTIVHKISYLARWYIPALQEKWEREQNRAREEQERLLKEAEEEVKKQTDGEGNGDQAVDVESGSEAVERKKKNVRLFITILLGGAALGGLGYLLYKKFKK